MPNVDNLEYRSGRIVTETNGITNVAGENGLITVTNWEQAVDLGRAFEMSAVANGSYAIPTGAKFALIATGTNIKIIMQGYEIFGDYSPFDITFYEDAVITGGTSVPMTATNRNRILNNASGLTLSMNIGLTSITGTALTPVAAYSSTTTSFSMSNTYGISERWNLAPNKVYAVYGYNKSGHAANVTARMLWIENPV